MKRSIVSGCSIPILAIALGMASGALAGKVYQEEQQRESWLANMFLRPARSEPGPQLSHARSLRDAGSTRRAKNQYRALVSTWPASVEAPVAQYEWARILEDQDKIEPAFEQYQALIDKFAGRFDFNDVISRQLDLAQRRADLRSFRFVFGGFHVPERALPMYEQILANAPSWERAAEIRYTMGFINETVGELLDAASVYAVTMNRHAGSPWAERAALRRVECLARLADRAKNDTRALDEVWFAVVDYIARHPASDDAARMTELRDDLLVRRARNAYEAARYYDRQRKSPEVVRTAYERFLANFPNTEWTDIVQGRLKELTPAKESTP